MANTSLHIKRIQQEIKDFQNNPSDTFHAEPLKEDLHVWHFTIKGPPDTEFEGGIYHGKIELPFDYPLKPPALYFLTPSGRYETNTKICLTITDYHPEHWNPGWTIKTMLKALISYFPEKEKVLGVGGLDFPAEERKRLALVSKKWECPACGPIKDIIQEKNEEEKKAEQEMEKAREIKRQEDEEVSVELALAAGQEKEKLDDIAQEIVEKPKEEEDEWEDEKEEEKDEQIIPDKKESNRKEVLKEEKKRDSMIGIEEILREKMNKKTIEVGLENLQTLMMQHIMYYETKRTVKYEKNVLNVEKPKEDNSLKAAREEAQRKRKEEEKQREREAAIDNMEDFVREEGGVEREKEEEVNAEEEAEVVKRTVEKEQIKKQLSIINLLIIVLLLGAVAVGVFM